MNPMRLWVYVFVSRCLPESRFFGLKNALLRWAGARIGTNVRIYSSATIVGTGALTIGDDVHVGSGVFVSSVAPAGVVIGSHVDVGPQVMILTGSHEIGLAGAHMAGEGTAASVSIGDGCWLGARTMVLPGVSLPTRTVTAAGAVVVTAPTESKTLLAGVPARVKKCYADRGGGESV